MLPRVAKKSSTGLGFYCPSQAYGNKAFVVYQAWSVVQIWCCLIRFRLPFSPCFGHLSTNIRHILALASA